MEDKVKQLHDILCERIRSVESGSHVIIFKPEKALKAQSFATMEQELIKCENAIIKLIELKRGTYDETIGMSLWTFIIIFYSKCFTSSKLAQLDAKQVFNGSTEMKTLHSEIIRIRHKYMAHRDDIEYLQSLAYVKLKNGVFPEFKVYTYYAHTIEITKLEAYLRLIQHVKNLVVEKYQEHFKLLAADYFIETKDSVRVKKGADIKSSVLFSTIKLD